MSSSNNEGEGSNKAIQLDTMSLDQLQQLQQREENRMQALTNRYAQLRSAAARLLQSAGAVQDLEEPSKKQDSSSSSTDAAAAASDDCATKDVFVPLTDSVYVPGKIRLLQPDAKDLLVELGTGYFVEKSSKETLEYIDRKLKLVDDNSANVTQAVQATRQNLDSIAMAMRGKIMEIQARQQGRMHRSAEEAN